MSFRFALRLLCLLGMILPLGCAARQRAATFHFVDSETGLPVAEAKVLPLTKTYQTVLPLFIPWPTLVPKLDSKISSNEAGEVAFESIEEDSKLWVQKAGYKFTQIESVGPSLKMKTVGVDGVEAFSYQGDHVNIPLRRELPEE